MLSHLTLWEKIKNDKNYNLILEDDVIIPSDMYKKINIIIKQLPNDWGFLFIGGNRIYGTKFSKNLINPMLIATKILDVLLI